VILIAGCCASGRKIVAPVGRISPRRFAVAILSDVVLNLSAIASRVSPFLVV
jgi:hypothetical protein